jgi:hypothetical protein
MYVDYLEDAYGHGEMHHSPYPIYPAYRGQPPIEYSPLAHGNEEFNPQLYEYTGLAHGNPADDYIQNAELQYATGQPEPHRIEGAYLNLQRVLTNPSRVMAPVLFSSIFGPGAFGRPAEVADSAPSPEVKRSFGQWTASPSDMVHTTPKAILDYDYQAVSQQDIADKARLALRKAIYGQ